MKVPKLIRLENSEWIILIIITEFIIIILTIFFTYEINQFSTGKLVFIKKLIYFITGFYILNDLYFID